MKMNAVSLLQMCLLVSYAGAMKRCCTPLQWESDNMIWEARIINGTTKFTQRVEHMSADNSIQKIAFLADVTSGGNTTHVHIIQDYPGGTEYQIYGNPPNLCLQEPLSPWTPTCVPDNATLVSSGYTGLTDRVTVDTYTFSYAQELTYFMSVTKSDCTPVDVQVYGSISSVPREISKTYKNFTVGIKDMSVFDVPVFCHHQQSAVPPSFG